MNVLIKSVEAEYRRYKAMAEGAFDQVPDEMLSAPGDAFAGNNWKYLSIPPGQSAAYNVNPVMEKPLQYAEKVLDKSSGPR